MIEQHIRIQDTTGNPAPLGLLAFGLTTVLLNFHNAGFYGFSSMILAMGVPRLAQQRLFHLDHSG